MKVLAQHQVIIRLFWIQMIIFGHSLMIKKLKLYKKAIYKHIRKKDKYAVYFIEDQTFCVIQRNQLCHWRLKTLSFNCKKTFWKKLIMLDFYKIFIKSLNLLDTYFNMKANKSLRTISCISLNQFYIAFKQVIHSNNVKVY